jgi:hypothetical protein
VIVRLTDGLVCGACGWRLYRHTQPAGVLPDGQSLECINPQCASHGQRCALPQFDLTPIPGHA